MLEPTQYSAALTVSCSWRGTKTDRLFKELDWEYLYHRRCNRRPCIFYKFISTQPSSYLFQYIPSELVIYYNLRNPDVLKQSTERTSRYSRTYFQSCIRELNLLDISVRNSPTLPQIKQRPIQIIRPPKRSTFSIHDIEALKLIKRLRVNFSDLCEVCLRHNFRCNSPDCFCGKGIEDSEHVLLHCHRYGSFKRIFLHRVSSFVDFEIDDLSSGNLCNLLLFGDFRLNLYTNCIVSESVFHFINRAKRFKSSYVSMLSCITLSRR